MRQYGGQLMTTGAQAQVYADHFIAIHLKEIGGGQTYSQLSAKALAQPRNAALAAQVQTMFRGETLRGLLLNAYAFGTIGQIMLWAAIAAFAGAGLLILLAIFGFIHLRRAAPEAGDLPPDRHPRAGRLLLTPRTGLPGAAGPPPPGPPGGGRWSSGHALSPASSTPRNTAASALAPATAPQTASAAGRRARACSRAATPDSSTTAILTISVTR